MRHPPPSATPFVFALGAALALAGCPRQVFVPGCEESVSTPALAESIPSIEWTGQDLVDRATWVFAHPDGAWVTGESTTVYVNVTADPQTVRLHTLTPEEPPPGAAVAELAPLCFDYLSVDAEIDVETDALRIDTVAEVRVTAGDDDPAMRSALVSHAIDPATLPFAWPWRALSPSEWDTVGLRLDLRLPPDRSAPGAIFETGERADDGLDGVAEATALEALSWGSLAGDDDDAAGDDDDLSDDDDDLSDDDDAGDDDDATGDDDDSAGPDCAAAQADLASTIYASIQGCTATVRLDYQTRDLLGYALLCGPYSAPDEATARASAEAATGYGTNNTLLSGASPEDQWVFWEAAGDFGGASSVDARTGLVTFGGSTVWDGAGDLVHPAAWQPAGDLAACPATPLPPIRRGFSLLDGGALPAADVDAALTVVYETALPGAFWSGGYVFDAVVLAYPRSVGVFDPSTAEWIVLLAGGWLE